jgi:hypothetical protein
VSILEYEGFGLVATEAAASGGIVLAANLDGLKDAVMNNRIGFFSLRLFGLSSFRFKFRY